MAQIEAGIASGVCGIMIHHERMNTAAYVFLEQLVKVLSAHRGVRIVNISERLQP
jgi:hypothetical protein